MSVHCCCQDSLPSSQNGNCRVKIIFLSILKARQWQGALKTSEDKCIVRVEILLRVFREPSTDCDHVFGANLALNCACAVSHHKQQVTVSFRLSVLMQNSKSQAVVNLRNSIWALECILYECTFFFLADLPS